MTRVCYCQVQFSMIEIYNEKVRDLLNTGKAPAGGLQIREDAKRGLFYGNFTLVIGHVYSSNHCICSRQTLSSWCWKASRLCGWLCSGLQFSSV